MFKMASIQFREYSELFAILKNQCEIPRERMVEIIQRFDFPNSIEEFLKYNICTTCNLYQFLESIELQFRSYANQKVYQQREFLTTRERSFCLTASLFNIFSGKQEAKLPLENLDLTYINSRGAMELFQPDTLNYSYVSSSFEGSKIFLNVRNPNGFESSVESYNTVASEVPVTTTSSSSNEFLTYFTYNGENIVCKQFAINQKATLIIACGLYKPVIFFYYVETKQLKVYDFIHINYPGTVIEFCDCSFKGDVVAFATTRGAFMYFAERWGDQIHLSYSGNFKSCGVSGETGKHVFFGTQGSDSFFLESEDKGDTFDKRVVPNNTGDYRAISVSQDGMLSLIGVDNFVYTYEYIGAQMTGYNYGLGNVTSLKFKGNNRTFLAAFNNNGTIRAGQIDTSSISKGFITSVPVLTYSSDKTFQNMTAYYDFEMEVIPYFRGSEPYNTFFVSYNYGKSYESKTIPEYFYGVGMGYNSKNIYYFSDKLTYSKNGQVVTAPPSTLELNTVSSTDVQTIEIDGNVYGIGTSQTLYEVVDLINSKINKSFSYSYIHEEEKRIYYELTVKN